MNDTEYLVSLFSDAEIFINKFNQFYDIESFYEMQCVLSDLKRFDIKYLTNTQRKTYFNLLKLVNDYTYYENDPTYQDYVNRKYNEYYDKQNTHKQIDDYANNPIDNAKSQNKRNVTISNPVTNNRNQSPQNNSDIKKDCTSNNDLQDKDGVIYDQSKTKTPKEVVNTHTTTIVENQIVKDYNQMGLAELLNAYYAGVKDFKKNGYKLGGCKKLLKIHNCFMDKVDSLPLSEKYKINDLSIKTNIALFSDIVKCSRRECFVPSCFVYSDCGYTTEKYITKIAEVIDPHIQALILSLEKCARDVL